MKNIVILLFLTLLFSISCSPGYIDRGVINLGIIEKHGSLRDESLRSCNEVKFIISNESKRFIYLSNINNIEIIEGPPRVYVEYKIVRPSLYDKENKELREAMRSGNNSIVFSDVKVRIYVPNLDSISSYIIY